MRSPPAESTIVLLIGAVQFVNVLEFMMVPPLGPDFSAALGIPTSKLGWLVAAYTGAAAVAGLLGGLVLDRYDRRRVLALALVGLVVGTFGAAFATSFEALVAARVFAGVFGGPATAVSLAIVTDVVPVERRGRALGRVMSGFALASVVGVPAVLELATIGGWTLPFFVVGGMVLLVGLGVVALLPPLTAHLAGERPALGYGDLLVDPTNRLAYLLTATLMTSSFILVPNIATYLQYNLSVPRDELAMLYFIGGLSAFFGLRWLGGLVDRFGPVRVAAAACGALSLGTVGWFIAPAAAWPSETLAMTVLFVPSFFYFPLFMFTMSSRNVALNTLITQVPRADERARFQSLQSATNHASSAFAGGMSSVILTETPDQSLVGMPKLALISITLMLLLPLVAFQLQRRVNARAPTRA